MDTHGICSKCLNEKLDVMLLANAKQGELVRIESFAGGPCFETRMLSMGLRKGEQARIINRLGQGQIVVAIENKRFVIGSKMGFKIRVTPVI